MVPDYVNSIDSLYIPTKLATEDSFETNNSENDAYNLTGSNNPFYSFVNIYIEDYDTDYFKFSF